MLRNTVLIVAALAVAMIVMPAAAQSAAQLVQQASASGGDGFTVQDWRMDSPVDDMDGQDGNFASQAPEASHAWAGPNGEQPSVILAGGLDDDPFLLDGRFRNGQMYTDRFGANNGDTTDKYAHKALRLSNGDVVMVGLVPKLGATSNPATGVGWNIGMVRYNSAGVKQKWTNAASGFVDSTKSYYVFPNKDIYDGNGSYEEISDVKEHDGRIYILAKRRHSATNQDFDLRVVRLSLNSSSWWWIDVLVSPVTPEWGVGMNFYTDGGSKKLTVAAGKTFPAGKYETWMLRYDVHTDGTLTSDVSFGTNGIRNVSSLICGDTCRPVAMGGSFLSPGVTYIAGNYKASSTDQDGYVGKFDKHGSPDTSFSNDGITGIRFWGSFDPMTANEAVSDIVVTTNRYGSADSIYVLATVENKCSTTSAGIAAFTYLGDYDTGFGTDGQLLFGGEGTDPPNCVAFSSITPRAMAVNGKRLAIVGYFTFNFLGQWGGPAFSVVDKDIGYVRDLRVLTPTGVDIGPNGGDGASYFTSVVANVDSFYVVGRAKDTKNHKKKVPMTARVRADRIFGNGLE